MIPGIHNTLLPRGISGQSGDKSSHSCSFGMLINYVQGDTIITYKPMVDVIDYTAPTNERSFISYVSNLGKNFVQI
jgi:hypothetical protein